MQQVLERTAEDRPTTRKEDRLAGWQVEVEEDTRLVAECRS
jgi:hypothetical protein